MEFSQILETQSHMVDHFFIEIAMGTYSAETDHISYIVGCMLITYSTVSLFVNQYIYISRLFFAVIGTLIIMIVMTMIILLVFYFRIYI